MNLKRRVYHSGSLVGNDVNKLTKPQNIRNISNIFKPKRIDMKKGKKLFSSHRLKVKIITLLGKFRQCYDLYPVARPLCKHEVGLLALRCSSFESWLPTNFPDESITPKMHVLTYHIPEKAKIMTTVGLEAEDASEPIHPVMNKLQRIYCGSTQRRTFGNILL